MKRAEPATPTSAKIPIPMPIGTRIFFKVSMDRVWAGAHTGSSTAEEENADGVVTGRSERGLFRGQSRPGTRDRYRDGASGGAHAPHQPEQRTLAGGGGAHRARRRGRRNVSGSRCVSSPRDPS